MSNTYDSYLSIATRNKKPAACAAQRLPFTVLGIIQFLSPVLTLLLGVFVFAEPLGTAQAAAIACVVVAAVLFVAGGHEERKRAADGEEK